MRDKDRQLRVEYTPKSRQSSSTGVNGGHINSLLSSTVEKVESLRKEWIRGYIKSKLWTQSRHETEANSCVVVWSYSSSVSFYEIQGNIYASYIYVYAS